LHVSKTDKKSGRGYKRDYSILDIEEIKKELDSGIAPWIISTRLEIADWAFNAFLRKHGLDGYIRKLRHFDEAESNLIVKLFRERRSITEIGKLTNRKTAVISNFLIGYRKKTAPIPREEYDEIMNDIKSGAKVIHRRAEARTLGQYMKDVKSVKYPVSRVFISKYKEK